MNFFKSRKNLLKTIEELELEINHLSGELDNYKMLSTSSWAEKERIDQMCRENEIRLIEKENELRAREIAILTLETVNNNITNN